MASCEICGKPVQGKRSTLKYCSVACRSKAYYRRKAVQRRAENATYSFALLDDIQHIGLISKEAEASLHKLMTIAGQEGVDLALVAVFDSLSAVGHIYNEKTRQWERITP